MDLAEIYKSKEFNDFNNLMIGLLDDNMNKGGMCIGFNFKNKLIESIKFYYVFFNKFDFNRKIDFPIPSLKEKYDSYIQIGSKSIYDIKSPGCGLTFALKFNIELESTKGFYFRVNGNNIGYVENIISKYPELNLEINDFDNGYGNFVCEKKGIIKESKYIYLNKTERLKQWENKFDIKFSKAGTVEINNANSKNNNQKFLLIHESENIGHDFKKKIPDRILNMIDNLNINLWSPAVNPLTNSNSIYIFDNPTLYRKDKNLINDFFNNLS